MANRASAKTDQDKPTRLTPTEFQDSVERANELYNEGQLAKAVEFLEATLKAAPLRTCPIITSNFGLCFP